jgi:hypothetical protein
MKTRLVLFLFAGAMSLACLNAQTTLKVTHTTSGTGATDEISFAAGDEITILDNSVSITGSSSQSYAFDKLVSLAFESGGQSTGIDRPVATGSLAAYADEAGVLHIASDRALERIDVYSLAGVRVATLNATASEAEIDLSAKPRGVYIVHTGSETVKVVR